MSKRAPRRTMTHEQAAWYDMVYRCTRKTHPRYKEYGKRGIKVYKAWLGSEGRDAFTSFMGPRPTPQHVLGRLDTSGDYVPGNVAWMTRSELRRLQSNTVKVDTRNGPVALVTLAEKAGKDPRNVRRRVAWYGWEVREALEKEWPDYRKLTDDQAREIYERRQSGETCQALADEYGVSAGLVSQIGTGQKRANATGEG